MNSISCSEKPPPGVCFSPPDDLKVFTVTPFFYSPAAPGASPALDFFFPILFILIFGPAFSTSVY
jgi:hypothetical protein